MSAPEDIGATLRAERARRGLTQAEVARAAGVSKALISHVERGRRSPSMKVLQAIAAVLETGVIDIVADAARAWRNGRSPFEIKAERVIAAEMLPDRTRSTDPPRQNPLSGWRWFENMARTPPALQRLVIDSQRMLLVQQDPKNALVPPTEAALVPLTRFLRVLEAHVAGTYRSLPPEVLVLLVAGTAHYWNSPLRDPAVETDTPDDAAIVLDFVEGLVDEYLTEFEQWAATPSPSQHAPASVDHQPPGP